MTQKQIINIFGLILLYGTIHQPSIKPPAAIGATRYKITNYTRKRAAAIGVEVKVSKTGNYKLDVYKKGRLIARVGDRRYNDYPTYVELEKRGKYPLGYADKRRRLYKARHQKTRIKKWSRSWISDNLLW